MSFDEVGERVWRRRFESLDFNVGVVEGDDGLLIIDTRASHGQADELRSELTGLSDKPVRWVVNTHWHWDHTFGNSRFPEAEIWGHETCRTTLVERGDEMKEGAKDWLPEEFHAAIDEVEVVPPSRTFTERASVAVGRGVLLDFHGRGHTDADIVVRVPDADVLFLGDLVEESAPPAFGDSHPLDWPATLASIPLTGSMVPGHGDVVDRAFVAHQLEELEAVARLAGEVTAGRGAEDAAAEGPYPAEVMLAAFGRL